MGSISLYYLTGISNLQPLKRRLLDVVYNTQDFVATYKRFVFFISSCNSHYFMVIVLEEFIFKIKIQNSLGGSNAISIRRLFLDI